MHSVMMFGRFELCPGRRLLLESGSPVRLGGRALDILVVLAQRAGDVVAKEELISHVWPGIVVEETNLRVHIAALRKALGDGQAGHRFITNVAGRGYSFVAPVSLREPQGDAADAPSPPVVEHRTFGTLPTLLTKVIGRADAVRTISTQLLQHRFVTIVGTGGMGKTTVALTVAEAAGAAYPDGIVFVDLTSASSRELAHAAVASTVGSAPQGEGTLQTLPAVLRDRAMLLVLDNCEHLIEAVAELAEALLRGAPHLAVLATSREPLRAEGEWVHRLPPLGLPPSSATLTARELMEYPAAQLFVERASASLGHFDLRDADAPVVAEICRRLDGIALAIEFAAGRLDTFGLREVAALLDKRFQILTRGRRTALPRHQTLRATLDWSYGILPEAERLILRQLSTFSGAFPLVAAREVLAGNDAALPGEVGESVAALVAKSLLTVEVDGAEPLYRMLETTRAYARERLAEAGEQNAAARRHAEYHRRLFERAEAEWETRPTIAWLAEYGRRIDDVRAALEWASGPQGDAAITLALTAAAVPLFFELSLVDECLAWVERALATVDPDADDVVAQRRRMQLNAALGWPQMYATSRIERGTVAWKAALELAEQLGDIDYQARALWALWADRINHADFRQALALAERFCRLGSASAASSENAELLVGERMLGASLHFMGDQSRAREHIERMLQRYTPPRERSHVVRFQFDQRVTARITYARILWLQGFPDQAQRQVSESVADATRTGHTLSLCNMLAQAACPIALLAGDLDAAERYTTLLRDRARDHALDVWRTYADAFEGEIRCRRGDVATGLPLLNGAIDGLRRANFVQYLTAFLAAAAQSLGEAGRCDQALLMMDEAFGHCDRTGERWAIAELQRIRAALALRAGAGAGAEMAEASLHESLRTARAQGALSWELRTSVSLADLWLSQGRVDDARTLLKPLVDRFTEGFATQDFENARVILEAVER